MLSDETQAPFFFGMGTASTVMDTDKDIDEKLILPDNLKRLEQPKREIGFNAAKAWNFQGDNQREHLRARAQRDGSGQAKNT